VKGLKKLKEMWDESPVAVLAAAGAAFMGASKLIDAISGVQSKRAYARQVRSRQNRK